MDFTRGDFGEIVPPLPTGSDEEHLAVLVAEAKRNGSEIDVPVRGRSRDGLIRVARVLAQSLWLENALAGDDNSAQGIELFLLVSRGEAISLAPAGMEDVQTHTFAPLLQRREEGWVVGLEGYGTQKRILPSDAPAHTAYKMAKSLYVSMIAQEESMRASWLADNSPPRHYVSAEILGIELELENNGLASVGTLDGSCLVGRWGNHSQYTLSTGHTSSGFHASGSNLAARYATTMLSSKIAILSIDMATEKILPLLPKVSRVREGVCWASGETLLTNKGNHVRITTPRDPAGYSMRVVKFGIELSRIQPRKMYRELHVPDSWMSASAKRALMNFALAWAVYEVSGI